MKPHVICLMAASVDGRTLHSRWRPKGSGADLFESVHDELAGDAWLVGGVTGQEFAKGKPYPASTKETFPREDGISPVPSTTGYGIPSSGWSRATTRPTRSGPAPWRFATSGWMADGANKLASPVAMVPSSNF